MLWRPRQRFRFDRVSFGKRSPELRSLLAGLTTHRVPDHRLWTCRGIRQRGSLQSLLGGEALATIAARQQMRKAPAAVCIHSRLAERDQAERFDLDFGAGLTGSGD